MEKLSKVAPVLNAACIGMLCIVLLAGYYVEFFQGLKPCSLCFLQRLGMMGVGVSLLLNLKEVVHPKNYGLAILNALFGAAVSARHYALKACCSAARPCVAGLPLCSWAFITFFCCFIVLALLLFLSEQKAISFSKKSLWLKGVFGLLFFVVVMGIVSCFVTRGFSL